MKWNYKNIQIGIREDGDFSFQFNEQTYKFNSLKECKYKIDQLTESFYTFTKKDFKELLDCLVTIKQKEFVKSLIDELSRHRFNPYCEIGISEAFLFDTDLEKLLED